MIAYLFTALVIFIVGCVCLDVHRRMLPVQVEEGLFVEVLEYTILAILCVAWLGVLFVGIAALIMLAFIKGTKWVGGKVFSKMCKLKNKP